MGSHRQMAPAACRPACLLLFLLFGTLAGLRIESEMCEQISLAAAARQGPSGSCEREEDVQGRSQAAAAAAKAKPLNPAGVIKARRGKTLGEARGCGGEEKRSRPVLQ